MYVRLLYYCLLENKYDDDEEEEDIIIMYNIMYNFLCSNLVYITAFSYGALEKSFPDRLTLGIGKFGLPQVLPQLSKPFIMLFGLPFDHERVTINI